MKIICLSQSETGVYPPIYQADMTAPPEGCAMVPDDLDTSVFYEYRGFVEVSTDGSTVTGMTGNQSAFDAWQAENASAELGAARADKLAELSASANAVIVAGCDVTLAGGNTEHFSLTEADQINLTAATAAVEAGAAGYPYHADGALCKIYPAADILAIGTAAITHKLYHTTYCNHAMTWARRAEAKTELDSIYYGGPLPDDLAANMEAVLNAAGG